jgi:hypothetical protein
VKSINDRIATPKTTNFFINSPLPYLRSFGLFEASSL